MEVWVIQTGVLVLLGLIGYLLRQKDVEQGKLIALLFKKHDEDAERLNKFELRIAQEHYLKPELDVRFTEIKISIKEAMDSLGHKFDKLSELLVAHIMKEDSRHDNKDSN